MESTKWTAQFNKSSFGTRSLLSILISTVENLERKTLRFLQIIPTAICRFQLMWMKKSSKNYFARHLGAFIKLFTYNKEMWKNTNLNFLFVQDESLIGYAVIKSFTTIIFYYVGRRHLTCNGEIAKIEIIKNTMKREVLGSSSWVLE